ncbi:hypothetical protein OCL06_15065 [Alteromonas sp. ASW11-19]|uniref:Solute-binding protein family 3/N-terminal domain-containing protein n=1 Tax=Alteromonas salexigens TaxID=2982530 RepID=A0ABT2VSL3_9ALTE|nr:hypothetical protein [Alteromonas salexigens]MCU7555908.1 hypothetical protein [Alteromonas salexigens]
MKLWLLMVATLFSYGATAKDTVFRVGTYEDHVPAIKRFIKLHGCPALGEAALNENQILAEYLIFCNALKASGISYELQISGLPVNSRIIDAVKSGLLHASMVGIWVNEVEAEDIHLSAPLFRENEFEKGLYTTRQLAPNFTSLDTIRNAITLTNENWHMDWALLQCAGLRLLHVGLYENMFKMLSRGRGELLPLTFSGKEDFERDPFEQPLVPVAGFKLVFPDSTHFLVSKQTPQSEALQKALEDGLKKLREGGEIKDTYIRLGIINPRVADWQPLGCAGTAPYQHLN